MKCWQGCLILSFLVLETIGCKSTGNTEALQRELRYQEDMIYQLQDYIRTYKCYLEECRQENESCKQTSTSRSSNSSILKKDSRPDVHLIPPGGLSPDEVQPPTVELPGAKSGFLPRFPADYYGKLANEDLYATQPITTQWSYPLPTNVTLARYQESILKDPRAPTPLAPGERIEDPVITALPFHQGLAGGYTEQGTFGGVWLLLAPQNATGQKVRPRGELSIALINPRAYSADAARIANWKFSPEQVDMITEDLPVGESLLLELPWSGEPPMDSLLQVYVRLITPEGNQLLVDQRIDLSQREPVFNSGPAGQGRGWRKRTRPRDFTTTDQVMVPQRSQRRLEVSASESNYSMPMQRKFKPTNWRENRARSNSKPDTQWKPYR
ncbi:MAG: hypothetical protein VX970_03845 [Planctomycetota bacterium]|nr:hypothetical protein [Planctomycetota bacterium]